jgi:hypothetical protein
LKSGDKTVKIVPSLVAAVGIVLSLVSPTSAAALIEAAAPASGSPPNLDYSDPNNWAARGEAEGAATAVAPGALPRRALRRVDVFYVHPTTDLRRDVATQDMADKKLAAWTDGSVIARQAGAFNRCCRIFAPRYHQATAGSGDVALKQLAFKFAYSDVLKAFDYYMAHENGGRPFILAGHSQGAAHLRQLLLDRIDVKPLRKKMVAAYVLGAGLKEGDFGRTFKSVAACDTPRQTGCVVQWNAFLATGDVAGFAGASEKSYVAEWGDNPGKTILCVNPLTFDRKRPDAPASLAKGAVPGAPDASPIQPLVPGAVGARCENGLLIVTPSAALSLRALTASSPNMRGSLHYHDVGLFYEDVRENADARAQAYLASASRRDR